MQEAMLGGVQEAMLGGCAGGHVRGMCMCP